MRHSTVQMSKTDIVLSECVYMCVWWVWMFRCMCVYVVYVMCAYVCMSNVCVFGYVNVRDG